MIPPLVAILLRLVLEMQLLNLYQAVAIAAAIPLVVAMQRRPGLVVRLLLIVLPAQLFITSWLYQLGLSGGLVRMLGLWKELGAVALVIAGWNAARRDGRDPDLLDRLVIGLAILGGAYLVLPELFVGSPGSELSLDLRLIAWRAEILPALIFLGARHARIGLFELGRLRRTVTGVALVMGAIAVVEFVASDWWNRFAVDTLGVNRFRVEVLQIDLVRLGLQASEIRTYGAVGGREIVRIGGPMVSYLTFSFFLLVLAGVLLEQVVSGRRSTPVAVGVGLVAAGVLFTQTRSSLVGGVVLVAAVLRPAPGRSPQSRVRIWFLAGAAMVLVIPLVFGSGLADRFTEGDAASDDVHDQRFDAAVENVKENPLGLGLGTIGNRGRGGEVVEVAENQFLDMGLQLGVLGMVLFTGIYFAIIRALRRAAMKAPGSEQQRMATGARNALIALLVPCWYLQPFSVPEVGWTVMGVAGAALGAVEAIAGRRVADEASEAAP